MTANPLLLPRCRALASMHVGWLLGWLLWSRNLQPIIRVGRPAISRMKSVSSDLDAQEAGLKSVPFITDPNPDAAKRAFDAMMQMRKIDIAAIDAARRG